MAISEYVIHFHTERPHQGLENRIIQPEFENGSRAGEVRCRKRLGGLLKYYYREAA
jgi:putative transposase